MPAWRPYLPVQEADNPGLDSLEMGTLEELDTLEAGTLVELDNLEGDILEGDNL